MNDVNSLSHTSWNCKYHIVFTPKYRSKIFYGQNRLEIGKILSETRERFSNKNTGIFEKWFTELVFSKRTVYNLLNRSNYIVQNLHNMIFIESLPITLSYELTNPMCSEEIREKILNGEIKNFRDFFEKKKILDEKNDEVEVLNFDDIFENDLRIFKKNFNKFNKVVNENFEKISKDKKENLTKEIEVLNRKIEKILKEFN